MAVPLISVVMPTYNYGRFIHDAVSSILGQTCGRLELIVVDDASTDETVQLLRQLRDPRLSIIEREENSCSGVLARNDGMRQAQGTYIAVADADDVSLPHRLDLQMRCLEDRQLDFVGGGVVPVDPSGQTAGREVIKPDIGTSGAYRAALLTGKTPLLHQTMLFRRAVLDRLDGYGPFLSSGDTEFLMRASRYFRFGNVEEVVVRARKHATSVTNRMGRKLKGHHHALFYARELEWSKRRLKHLRPERVS